MKSIIFLSFFFSFSLIFAQENPDSTGVELNQITVKAFETNRQITDVAAPVSIITPRILSRFDNSSLVSAFNIFPGVRMEERSPGSYRLAIRGSSVRSPFGVRNVKIYWNDIPLTDANGITYFNLVDMNTLGGVEILKGPSGSIYGAGIGGVVLMENQTAKVREGKKSALELNSFFGTFNTQNRSLNFTNASEKNNTFLNYSHAQTDGYREHSNMRRDAFNFRNSIFLNKNYTLNVTAYYADIYYQTPGGLNQDQVLANPKSSRPATRFTPGSIEQKAAIYQKMFFAGLSQEVKIGERWKSFFAVFAGKSKLENPFITNYEIRNEKSVGIRNKNVLSLGKGLIKSKLVFGTEIQTTSSKFDVYDNKAGLTGKVQYQEEVNALQTSVFGQVEVIFPGSFFVTAGLSGNAQRYNYERVSDRPNSQVIEDFSKIPVMPRLSILKNFKDIISLYTSYGKGFSSPTVQEFATGYQSISSFVPLAAELGENLEIGAKGQRKGFSYEINYYHLDLKNAIVRRTNDAGIESFVNSGQALQQGFESMIQFQTKLGGDFNLNSYVSFAANNYKYQKYKQLDLDFSGNLIPSVPQNVFTAGMDISHKLGFFLNTSLYNCGKIYLDDSNTFSADPYSLLNTRVGWIKQKGIFDLKIYAGADNLLNETYSLGNDTNAFGNRFFNPAATRTFNAGFATSVHF